MEQGQSKNQIKLENILLIKSEFQRELVINFAEQSKVKQDININIENTDVTQNKFAVYLEVDFQIMYEDKVLISIKTSHTATFDKQGSSIEDKILDNFININAPAIIFPFVREEIASLTSKAGVGGVLIQPVNFIELNNKRIANLKKDSEL